MITIFGWTSGQQTGRWMGTEVLTGPEATKLRDEMDSVWIDLEEPTAEEEDLVFKQFLPVHPLTFEDVIRPRRMPDSPPHLPKVEEFPDYLFVIVNPLKPGTKKRIETRAVSLDGDNPVEVTQLSAILTKRVLITHHMLKIKTVGHVREFVDRHEAQCGRGPDYLFHLILDEMVDRYAPLLDHIDESLDRIELQVFRKPDQGAMLELVRLKRAIILLRKTLVHEREVLARLCRGEFSLIDDREMVYYRNVYDHIVRSAELIESSREMVSDLMATHLSAASHRLNEVMKVLTMISTIVLPMSLIAGVYGMNFDSSTMEQFHTSVGFWYAVGLMTLTGVGALAFFRWKGWF